MIKNCQESAQIGRRELPHRVICSQNLPRGLKNSDDVTLVPIFSAGLVCTYIKNGNQSDVNIALSEFI